MCETKQKPNQLPIFIWGSGKICNRIMPCYFSFMFVLLSAYYLDRSHGSHLFILCKSILHLKLSQDVINSNTMIWNFLFLTTKCTHEYNQKVLIDLLYMSLKVVIHINYLHEINHGLYMQLDHGWVKWAVRPSWMLLTEILWWTSRVFLLLWLGVYAFGKTTFVALWAFSLRWKSEKL